MFDTVIRDRVQAAIVKHAERDGRITAAALVGSLATGGADRWSDLDFAFGVAEGVATGEVIDDWSRALASEFHGTALLDLHSGGAQYRVFLLPGCLQVDLSFAPGGDVLQGSPRLHLLFGTTRPMQSTPPSSEDLFGWGVLYARHAYVCIQRQRWWQAAFCITAVRNAAMDLACLARQLPERFGRGYDDLPEDLLLRLEATIFADTSPDELTRALRAAIRCLIGQGSSIPWAKDVQGDLAFLADT